MKFTVTSGNPTPVELLALKAALDQHKVQDLKPVIKRSLFGIPQLRQPLPHQKTFGARRKFK
ncbi:MAG: acyl-CoA carboxylase subunit epsilon [Candidatus Planktophila sp.]|nr:acyl-CoA carboxylase subunit epsilon [Candidatus Planktophila sp.]